MQRVTFLCSLLAVLVMVPAMPVMAQRGEDRSFSNMAGPKLMPV